MAEPNVADKLAQVPIFSGCTKRELAIIARASKVVSHKEGTVIAREGERGIGPFLILEGKLKAVDALFESFELTAGHGGKLLVLLLLRCALFVAGLITLGLGIVPGAVWSDLALATYYHRVIERRPPPGFGADLV